MHERISREKGAGGGESRMFCSRRRNPNQHGNVRSWYSKLGKNFVAQYHKILLSKKISQYQNKDLKALNYKYEEQLLMLLKLSIL